MLRYFCLIATLLCFSQAFVVPSENSTAPTPVVLWHGMGDSCCNPLSMGAISKLIQQQIPGVYIHSIEIGDTVEDDIYNSFFMNVNDQIDMACQMLANDPNLRTGPGGYIDVVGFSQGGQFLRAFVERCNDPPVRNLISVGGQHQGVFGFPRCPGANETLCNWVRDLLNLGAYVSIVQDHLVQAEYWQDPLNEDEYLKYSVFLPDINNNLGTINQTYKDNIMSLDNFALVLFTEDTMVQPRESEWFGFYLPGQAVETFTMQESDLYKEDWIGLQELDNNGKLHFLSCVGDHLQFTDEWFINNIVPFLNGTYSE